MILVNPRIHHRVNPSTARPYRLEWVILNKIDLEPPRLEVSNELIRSTAHRLIPRPTLQSILTVFMLEDTAMSSIFNLFVQV